MSPHTPPSALRQHRLGVFALLIGSLTACSSPEPAPEALVPPSFVRTSRVVPAVGLDAGPPGSEVQDPSQVEGPLELRVRAHWLREPLAPRDLAPLAARVDVVIDLEGGAAPLTTPELTASALVAEGDAARAWLERLAGVEQELLLDETRALPTDGTTTWEVDLVALETAEDPRDWLDEFPDRGPFPRAVGLHLTPDGATLRTLFRVTDLDPDGERALFDELVEEPDVLPGPPRPRYEEALRTEAVRTSLARPADGALTFVLEVDPPFDTGTGTTLVLVVEEIDGDTALEPTLEARAASVEAAERSSAPLTTEAEAELVRAQSLLSFQRRGGRTALLALAREADAPLAADLALVATDDDLAALADAAFPTRSPREIAADAEGAEATFAPAPRIQDSVPGDDPLGASVEPITIRWRLESSSWRLLSQRALDGELSDELTGVLLRHAGALARYPDVVLDALRRSGESIDAFADRLIAEQKLALEDSSPSTRVRAHDWLVARDQGVDGYDPLGTREERRTALEAATAEEPQR